MITDYWKDTGTPDDIIHANMAVLRNMKSYFHGKKDETSKITGNVMIGKGTVIQENSQVDGPVIIGENCIIGPNTKIGPNTSIGNNSKLSKCDIEDCIIMSDCEIDCNIKIRYSIISTDSSILLSDNNNYEKIFLLGEGTKILL
jgi:glucose-1-phosphate thymidylyltransferase